VLRNVGVPIGHTIIAFEATLKGLKIVVKRAKIPRRFRENWAVVAEAIQTIYVVRTYLILMKH
jgi:adenylosuccinate lyase